MVAIAKKNRKPANAVRQTAQLKARIERLWSVPVEFMDHESFRARNADAAILGPAPETTGKKGRLRAPSGIPPYLASLYEVPLLSAEEEVYYFRKMNYLKYKAFRLQKRIKPYRARKADVDRLEALLREAGEVKNLLVRTNLRLVVSIAKKYARPNLNFFEIVSDGNVSLMRAIEKFDFSRGFKFSTYATWAIKKNFMRSIPTEFTQLERFRTGTDEMFHYSRDQRSSHFAQERQHEQQRDALGTLMDKLQERDRDILSLRFGLGNGNEPLTLEQVGNHFGVSKERVRQLEARALRRLRDIADEEKLDIPGI